MKLTPFGTSLLKVDSVALVTVAFERHLDPAVGVTVPHSEYGSGNLYAAKATLNLRHATPSYFSFGYEKKADAVTAATEFINFAAPDPISEFIQVSSDTWVRRSLVASVSKKNYETKQIWLDLHAATLGIDVELSNALDIDVDRPGMPGTYKF
jgi:hypothetical protein